MANITSPLRYPGGKSRVAKQLVSFFPTFDEYREPFLGGGSVFFRTTASTKGESYWINDLNTPLICFWTAARDSIDDLVREINYLRNNFPGRGKELNNYLKKQYQANTTVCVAARFFILNRITFSGLTDSGGYSDESFLKRFTDSSINRLREISVLLQNVKITNLDYSELLFSSGRNVLMFCDPPYYSQRHSKLYGKNGDLHTQFDHSLFAASVAKCQHKWMITYDDDPYIRELYKDFYIEDWSLQYGMGQKDGTIKRGNELVITNYKLSSVLPNLFAT